jgi:hypothetical protein
MSDASSTLTPERLAEIERDAARRLREPWLYPLSPSVTLALCAALRAAWAERDRLREEGYQAAFEWAAERDRLAEEVERLKGSGRQWADFRVADRQCSLCRASFFDDEGLEAHILSAHRVR